MNGYAKAAVEAAKWTAREAGLAPVDGWRQAVAHEFPQSVSQQKKGCPRGAFLGLCEEGFVTGISRGDYTRAEKNKTYAVNAARLLLRDRDLASNIAALWHRSIGGAHKSHNSQMNVVIALFQHGLLSSPKD